MVGGKPGAETQMRMDAREERVVKPNQYRAVLTYLTARETTRSLAHATTRPD